jgi:hypothetical protein
MAKALGGKEEGGRGKEVEEVKERRSRATGIGVGVSAVE